MSDVTTRAELFAALTALAELMTQMRVGQLVAAIGELCSDRCGRGLWDAEDSEFLEAVRQFCRGVEEAGAGVSPPPGRPIAGSRVTSLS